MRQLPARAIQTPDSGGLAAVSAREVVVAVEPRLFRDMLSRLIGRIEGLHLRAELPGPSGLALLLEQTEAQWVIVSLAPDGTLPEEMNTTQAGHASLSILGVAEDGSRALVKRAGMPPRVMANPSLALLLRTIREGGQHGQAADGGDCPDSPPA